MLGAHWFLRMKRWVQHPPSPRRAMLVLAVVAACLALYGLEQAGFLPDWMEAERVGGRAGLPRF